MHGSDADDYSAPALGVMNPGDRWVILTDEWCVCWRHDTTSTKGSKSPTTCIEMIGRGKGIGEWKTIGPRLGEGGKEQ